MKSQVKTIRFKNRTEFHASILDEYPRGGMFVETETDYPLDEPIQIQVCFPEIPEGVPLSCNVVWRRSPVKWSSALKPGVGVTVDTADQHRWNFLKRYVADSNMSRRLAGPRIASNIDLQLICEDFELSAKAGNIGPGGLFVSTDAPIVAETAVEMDILFETEEHPLHYFGQVMWRREDHGEKGLGVAFKYRAPEQRTQILSFIEQDTSQRLCGLYPGSYSTHPAKSKVSVKRNNARQSAEELAISDLLSIVRQHKKRQSVTPYRTTMQSMGPSRTTAPPKFSRK